MFTELTERIIEKTSSDDLVSKNKPGDIKKTPDEMLDLLERRIGRTEIIKHLKDELKTEDNADINTHKAILKLASLHEKNIIITTNFDDLFDKAQNILNDHKITEYIHPNLPNNWELGNSLTYIHGKLDNVNNEDLILNQSDFSRHYMLKNHAKYIVEIETCVKYPSYNLKQHIDKIDNIPLKKLWFKIIDIDLYLEKQTYSDLTIIEQQKILKYELRFLYDHTLLNQIFKWEFIYSTNTDQFKRNECYLQDISDDMPFSISKQLENTHKYLKLMDKKFVTEFLTELLHSFDVIIAYSESNNNEFNFIEHIFINACVRSINNMNDIKTYIKMKDCYNILVLNTLLAHEILPYIEEEFIFNIVDKHIFYLLSVIIFCVKNKEQQTNDKLINKITSKLINNILDDNSYVNTYSQTLLILLVNYFPACMTKDYKAQLQNSSNDLTNLNKRLLENEKYPLKSAFAEWGPTTKIPDNQLLDKILHIDSIDDILEIISQYDTYHSNTNDRLERVDLHDIGESYSKQQNTTAFNILLYTHTDFTNRKINQFVSGIFDHQSSKYGKDVINELYLKLPKDICNEYMHTFVRTLQNIERNILPCDISKLIHHIFELNLYYDLYNLNDLLHYMMYIFSNNKTLYNDWLNFIKDIDNNEMLNLSNNILIEKVPIHSLLNSNHEEFDNYIQRLFSLKHNAISQLIERYKLIHYRYTVDKNTAIFLYDTFLFLIKNSDNLNPFQSYKIIDYLIFTYQQQILEKEKFKEFFKHCDKEFLLKFIEGFKILEFEEYIKNIEIHKKHIDFIFETFPLEKDKRPKDFKKTLIKYFGSYVDDNLCERIVHKGVEEYIKAKLSSMAT